MSDQPPYPSEPPRAPDAQPPSAPQPPSGARPPVPPVPPPPGGPAGPAHPPTTASPALPPYAAGGHGASPAAAPPAPPQHGYGQLPGGAYPPPGGYAPPVGYPQHGAGAPPYAASYGMPGTPPPGESKGLAITAFVLGIVGMLGAMTVAWIPVVGFGALLVPLVALVLSIYALAKRKPGKGFSVTGLVLGALALLTGGLLATVSTVLLASFTNAASERAGSPFSPGLPSDPAAPADPREPYSTTETIALGTPFEVTTDEGTSVVTINDMAYSSEPLPGTGLEPLSEAFLVLDVTWEVVDGEVAFVDAYELLELTDGMGEWYYSELDFDGMLSADDLAEGDVAEGFAVFDVDPADGPFLLDIYSESHDLVFRGALPSS
ncbi:hypothetical protein [Microbacterium album]|uniref:DUF4190 domain-containing protein n=1 Tax=Microbacterium album TaxID=2053191 RepID=A0A917IF04_9MICO|nr:hypothetical protein [Microbacterium album]GGH40010.1 hypothetical protein GCM10010921_11630 [Microbacterium album]